MKRVASIVSALVGVGALATFGIAPATAVAAQYGPSGALHYRGINEPHAQPGMPMAANSGHNGEQYGMEGGKQPAAQSQVREIPLSKQTMREIQASLQKNGFPKLVQDGEWGPRTRRAIEQFQHERGLHATGKLDPETLAALGVTVPGQARRT
jgi:hypothetical protein